MKQDLKPNYSESSDELDELSIGEKIAIGFFIVIAALCAIPCLIVGKIGDKFRKKYDSCIARAHACN